MPPALPSSPIQKMRAPLLHAVPISIRPRGTTRYGVLVVALVCIIFTLNELRCEGYGCLSRVSFYGRDGERKIKYIGGGSVLGGNPLKAMGDAGWDPQAFRNQDHTRMKGSTQMLPKIIPWASDNDGPMAGPDKEQVKQHGAGILVGLDRPQLVPTPTHGIAVNLKWIDSNQGIPTHLGSKEPSGAVATPKPWKAESAKVPAPSKSSHKIIPSEKHAIQRVGVMEWDGRANDPSINAQGDSYKALAKHHSKWEQGEGQEDPVRVLEPKNHASPPITGDQKKAGSAKMNMSGVVRG